MDPTKAIHRFYIKMLPNKFFRINSPENRRAKYNGIKVVLENVKLLLSQGKISASNEIEIIR